MISAEKSPGYSKDHRIIWIHIYMLKMSSGTCQIKKNISKTAILIRLNNAKYGKIENTN